MTQAQTRTHGVGSPSISQHLLAAMLCAFVEPVLNVIRKVWMALVCLVRGACHISTTHDGLPAQSDGISKKETVQAARCGDHGVKRHHQRQLFGARLSTASPAKAGVRAACEARFAGARKGDGEPRMKQDASRSDQTPAFAADAVADAPSSRMVKLRA